MGFFPPFLVSLYALFVAPQFFATVRDRSSSLTLKAIWGFVASVVWIWFSFLVVYALHLGTWGARIFVWGGAFAMTIYSFLKSRTKIWLAPPVLGRLFVAAVLLIPLAKYLGDGFSGWDAIVSWNRWALELYEGRYEPLDAAYPIFMPALWSLIYKLQGTPEIWSTAQSAMLFFPFEAMVILLLACRRSRSVAFALMFGWSLIALIHYFNLNGYMDLPVMTVGLISLIAFYLAEHESDDTLFNRYLFAGLMAAGVASVVKQAGWSFLLFGYLYGLSARRGRLGWRYLLPPLFFGSYLLLYLPNSDSGIAGNIAYLHDISDKVGDLTDAWDLIAGNFFFIERHALLHAGVAAPFASWMLGAGAIAGIAAMVYVLVKQKERRPFRVLLFLFMVGGTLFWLTCLSYDFRNLVWVKAFFIVAFGDSVSAVWEMLQERPPLYNALTLLLLSLVGLGAAFAIDADRLIARERAVKERLGDRRLALQIRQLLAGRPECVKVYTDILPLTFNPLLAGFTDRIVPLRYHLIDRKVVEHDCAQGRYLFLRKSDLLHREIGRIERLAAEGYIRWLDRYPTLAYFIPPGIRLPKNYLKSRTSFSARRPLRPTLGKTVYHIDRWSQSGDLLKITGWAISRNGMAANGPIYLLLRSKNKEYLIVGQRRVRADVLKASKTHKKADVGFVFTIDLKELKAGRYAAALLEATPGGWYAVNLDRDVTIQKRKR